MDSLFAGRQADIAEYHITKRRSRGLMNNMNVNKALLVIVSATAAFAQNAPRPEFEVATIRPSAQTLQDGVTAGVRIDGAQVRCALLTLKDYIGIAYRIKLYQVSGPDWLGSERFDISGTVPAGIPTTQFPEMLQSLLEERFKLKIHRDKKDFPVYVLEVAKGGLKMQESAPDPDLAKADAKAPVNVTGSGGSQGIAINYGRGTSYTFANNRFEAKRFTTELFAGNLERFVDRPIVDMTGLKGTYDIVLDVTQEDYRAMLIRAGLNAGVSLPPEALRLLDGASVASLLDAIQKLGLKLDARKAPLDLVVVDDVRKTPTEN
jgi:uncharacterized protein (TIGR03435 family)